MKAAPAVLPVAIARVVAGSGVVRKGKAMRKTNKRAGSTRSEGGNE